MASTARKQYHRRRREIAELRAEGLSWDEIAAGQGGRVQARRMKRTSAIERTSSKQLGLDELYE